jgi:hypothetical protein
MRWIEKSRNERIEDVSALMELLLEKSPDRFWLSSEQDGPDKQIMHIILPIGQDIYYDVTLMTAGLKAARMAAHSLGQLPGERVAITPAFLDNLGMLKEEVFLLDHEHENGIGLELVLDVPGLTHQVIDTVLGKFIDNGQMPLVVSSINPYDLVSRMIEVREAGKHDLFPL